MRAILLATVLISMTGPAWAQHTHDSEARLQQPGHGAFAAIQEVTTRLEADASTDWSAVDVEELRQHLIDMDYVTLRAEIRMTPTDGGARFDVTGTGRTLGAIQRMVIGHVRAMGDAEHWTLAVEETPTGAIVTALAKEPGDVARIRGLGLIGILADGAHHQPHHWMLATGQRPHH